MSGNGDVTLEIWETLVFKIKAAAWRELNSFKRLFNFLECADAEARVLEMEATRFAL